MELGRPPALAVLGCADGKFVLPAARQGCQVLAIDLDKTALYGGTKPGPEGDVHMPGLVHRLRTEKLTELVRVILADFAEYQPEEFDAVFTSGSIQYSNNMPKTAAELMNRVLAYVKPGGFVYVDYMLPWEERYRGRPNCPDEEWWKAYPRTIDGFGILHNIVVPPVKDFPHVEVLEEHYHHWGHLLMRRKH